MAGRSGPPHAHGQTDGRPQRGPDRTGRRLCDRRGLSRRCASPRAGEEGGVVQRLPLFHGNRVDSRVPLRGIRRSLRARTASQSQALLPGRIVRSERIHGRLLVRSQVQLARARGEDRLLPVRLSPD